MGKWGRAFGLVSLIISCGMAIVQEWRHHRGDDVVIHEHSERSFYAALTQEAVRITSLWGMPATRSVSTRFHLVA
jgi:hypothetical protein